MAEVKPVEISIDDAVQEFEGRQSEFQEAGSYYRAEPRDLAVGIATPPQLRKLLAQVGIPRVYVNAMAERLILEGFLLGNQAEVDQVIWSWYKANQLDSRAFAAYVETLVYGRSYITISVPGKTDLENPLAIPDVPIIRLESPMSLFAKIDPRTLNVQWAIRVAKNEDGETAGVTMYHLDRTEIYGSVEGTLVLEETIAHGLGVVPVIPITHQVGLTDIYGTSAITPEIKSVTDALSRLMMNMQTTSELMATPQRIIFGSSVDELMGGNETGLELYTSSYIAVEDPAGKAEQLPAAELRNYTEAMDHILRQAAIYTGLPPQYLAQSSDNPASAEAILNAENHLVRTCEALSAMFGDAWERAMRIALLITGTALTIDHFQMESLWRNPATPTYQAMADAATKMYASGNGIIPLEQARIDMGYTPEQRNKMREWDEDNPLNQMAGVYGKTPVQGVSDEPVPDGEPTSE